MKWKELDGNRKDWKGMKRNGIEIHVMRYKKGKEIEQKE